MSSFTNLSFKSTSSSSSSSSSNSGIGSKLLILSSIILIPYFLSLIHLSPFSILLSIPLILIIWFISIPLALLFTASLADSTTISTSTSTSSTSTFYTSTSHLNPIRLPSRPFSHLQPSSFRTSIHSSSTSVSESVDHLISLILRDFIKKWHTPLLFGSQSQPQDDDDDQLFPLATEKSIREALISGLNRATSLDLPNLAVGKILPTLTDHLSRLRIAERELAGVGDHLSDQDHSNTITSSRLQEKGGARKAALSTSPGSNSEEVDLFLAAKYQTNSHKLHPAVSNVSSPNSKPSELDHLRKLAERMLGYLLPDDERGSKAVFVAVREVVACTILMPVVDMMSDTDFWNGILDQKTGAAIQEQKLVQRLRQALERQKGTTSPLPPSTSTSIASNLTSASAALGNLTGFSLSSMSTNSQPSTGSKSDKFNHQSFSTFLKNIEDAASILEARRSRNDVAVQIRKTKSALAAVTSGGAEAVERKAGLVRYLERLHVALGAAEKRVEELSMGNKPSTKNSDLTMPTSPSRGNSSPNRITLSQVIHNASTLSYWMEHMDRRKRSELIQFWLAVESFKDPLESVESENEEIEPSSFTGLNPDPSTVSTLKEDLKLFTEIYYPSTLLNIKPIYISTAETFIKSDSATPSARQVHKVRESVLKAQRQVFKEMLEDDWPIFNNSDLFFKAQDDLARDNNTGSSGNAIHSRVSSASGMMTPSDSRSALSFSSTSFFSSSNARPTSKSPHTSRLNSDTPRSVTNPNPSSSFSNSSTEASTPLPVSRPSMNRANSDHADLFGKESPPAVGPGNRTFFSSRNAHPTSQSLFGEEEDQLISGMVSPKLDSMNDNFHVLVGSTKGSRKGADGRAPLFDTDPLFEDGEEEEDDGLFGGKLSSDAPSSRESEYVKVEIEMMDAVTSILEDEDSRVKVEKDRKKAKKLKDSRDGETSTNSNAKSTAARDLRPAFKKTGTGNTIGGGSRKEGERNFSSKGIFEEDADVRGEEELDPTLLPQHRRGSSSSSEDDLSANLASMESSELATAPLGTLDLSTQISRLSEKLDKLLPQEEILAALMRKAELTGAKEKELRLLTKSRSAVGREVKELVWQLESLKKQHEEQKLRSGRTRVRIKNTTIGTEDGKEYAMYLVEVNQLSLSSSSSIEATPSSGWIVGRRYSEFFALHQRLKERFQEVRTLEAEFPGRRLVGLVNPPFVDARRVALDKYIQLLVKIPKIVESPELSIFLSKSHSVAAALESSPLQASAPSSSNSVNPGGASYPGQGIVKTLFKGMTGVAEGLDDLIFGQSMFELVMQRLVAQSQSASLSSNPTLSTNTLDSANVEQAMQGATLAEVREAAAAGTTYFTEPICDLVSEIFELKRENNWLRRQAIVIILQQVLGGTIERKLRETISNALAPTPLLSYIASLQSGLWPNGELKEPSKPRTSKEKAELKESANRKLTTFIPDVSSNFIGRQNARRGARRLFSAFQNRRLNRHLIYTILDQIFDELFPSTS